MYVDAFIQNACPDFGITEEFVEELKAIGKQFEGDVKYESFIREVNKLAGKLEGWKKVKDFSS
jgi:hypothetical protein